MTDAGSSHGSWAGILILIYLKYQFRASVQNLTRQWDWNIEINLFEMSIHGFRTESHRAVGLEY